MPRKKTLNEIKSELKVINPDIEIIDDQYLGNKLPIKCQCKICNHKWSPKWNNLSSNKSGCPKCYESGKRLSIEDMVEYAEENNYEILRFHNLGTNRETNVELKCPNNHSYTVRWNTFRSGRRCKKCSDKEIALKRRNNDEEVRREIEHIGYVFIHDFKYENNKTLFTVQCSKGHKRTMSYNQFCKVQECPECTLGRKLKYNEEDISEILDNLGLVYIGGYINSHTTFKYMCSCGNEADGILSDLRSGHRCMKCFGNKVYTLEELCNLFKEHGCELLETDVSHHATRKLKFTCSCGREGCKTYYNFLKKPQCTQCSLEGRSGENSPRWNPNLTDEERINKRKYPEYQKWRLSVYERDSYTCQCCGDNKGSNLNAHHLDGHEWAIDKRLDVDNGITLCDLCHTDFHKIYGYHDNTKEQFDEYISDILEDIKQLII